MVALSIPTDAELLVPWLEEQVVGMQLGRLVRELNGIHQPANALSLQDIVGNELSAVMVNGLNALPVEALQSLLHHPSALVELQERAFISGEPYWEQLASRGEAGRRSERMKSSVLSILKPIGHDTRPNFSGRTPLEVPQVPRTPERQADPPLSQRTSVEPPSPEQLSEAASSHVDSAATRVEAAATNSSSAEDSIAQPLAINNARRWRRLMMAVSTAALLVFGVMSLSTKDRVAPGWGLGTATALTETKTEAEFFTNLANAADQWHNKVPENAEELEVRLTEFSDGCQGLIDALQAPGSPTNLSPESQLWLLGKCRKWKADMDGFVTAVQEDQSAFASIKQQADSKVAALVETLRTGPPTSA